MYEQLKYRLRLHNLATFRKLRKVHHGSLWMGPMIMVLTGIVFLGVCVSGLYMDMRYETVTGEVVSAQPRYGRYRETRVTISLADATTTTQTRMRLRGRYDVGDTIPLKWNGKIPATVETWHWYNPVMQLVFGMIGLWTLMMPIDYFWHKDAFYWVSRN